MAGPEFLRCNYFARYLLHSGVMRWCVKEAAAQLGYVSAAPANYVSATPANPLLF